MTKVSYRPKLKNELALKKYIKNADKKQPKRTSRSNRAKQYYVKRNDFYKLRAGFKNNTFISFYSLYYQQINPPL